MSLPDLSLPICQMGKGTLEEPAMGWGGAHKGLRRLCRSRPLPLLFSAFP